MRKPKFKIGETVICIDDRPRGKGNTPDVVYKQEYTIRDFNICECGDVSYDVGLISISNVMPPYTKCWCERHIPGRNIHWCGEFRFEKAIKDSTEESISEMVEMIFTKKELIKQPVSAN